MSKERILIVDDNEELLNLLDLLFSNLYDVLKARDGEQGLLMAQRDTPDLILLDMNMPRMTGMEMLAALRETECQVPVIFMTGEGSVYVAVEAFRLGVHDYLTKPFSSEEAQAAKDLA